MEEQENTNDDTLEKPKTAPNDNQQQDTQAQPQTQSKSLSQFQFQSQSQPQTDNKLTQNLNNNMQLPLATEPSTSKVAQAVATVSSTSTPASFKTIPALAATVTTYSAATTFIDNTLAAEHSKHSSITKAHNPQQQESFLSRPLSFEQANQLTTTSRLIGGSTASISSQQQAMDRLSRSMAFDKMEALVREMQDTEHGVPCRHQKIFLTSIPYAFMGYDLIEWLMDRLIIEESEALSIANQLCLHGYFFPVSDTKSLTVKDDSSLYRFQTPYYWPCQHKAPDNVEYAIYLTKRTLRNKQRHALEDYEAEALQSLHKNLKGKWDFISMQAEEQVRLSKERKKGDKIVADSQERAYWRVHRPPPGQFTPLEPCPIPSRDRQGTKPKRKNIKDVEREVEYLRKSLNRTRMKMSLACESLVQYSNTFSEYDFFLRPVLPSNPWVTEDITFWQLNNTFVDIPTELRVKRWAISIEELVSDPTGLQEFTNFLEKEFSHENIRFWIAVNKLRRSAHSQVTQNVKEIYEEFLKPGAPCEINIDGKTMERVLKDLENPSRFAFDAASEHIYMLLLKKDCYPRFIRSEHYKRLLETGIQPAHKKRFFNFSAVSGAKKKMTDALRNQPMDGNATTTTKTLSGSGTGNANLGMIQTPSSGTMTRRRGSDRSLSGSAHELTVMGVNKEPTTKVIHSHSQSNLNEIPFRDITKKPVRLETTLEHLGSSICPWDDPTDTEESAKSGKIQLSICPWEQDSDAGKLTPADSIEVTDPERGQRNILIRHQHTVDSTESGVKRLIPHTTEQRRASVSFTSSLFSEKPMEKYLSESPSLDSHTLPVNTKPILREDMNLNKLTINKTENRVKANLTTTPITTPTPPLKKQSCLSTDNIFETSNNKDNENVIRQEAQKTNIKLNEKEQVEVKIEGEVEVDFKDDLKEEEEQKEAVEEGTVQDVQIELIENMETVSVHDIEIQTDVNADVHVEVEVDVVLDLELLSDDKKKIISTTLLLDNETPAKPNEDYAIIPEELSPTSDEYQEGSQIQENHSDICDFEISDSCTEYGGYVPPAPTPAPSLAPLAELDNDNVDDDLFEAAPSGILQTPTTTTTPTTTILNSGMEISTTGIEQQQQEQHQTPGDEIKKRRKKRSSVKNRATSGETTNLTGDQISNIEQNTVCPWEDENNTSNGGSFVKTYATLGYL